MTHLHDVAADGIKNLKWGNQFAATVNLYFQATGRCSLDAFCQIFDRHSKTGKFGRPRRNAIPLERLGGDAAPCATVILGFRTTSQSCCYGNTTNKLSSFHFDFSP